eukprot:SM000013S26512  [mRNA]  locus=s13:780766:781457:- [translate_table: standard]
MQMLLTNLAYVDYCRRQQRLSNCDAAIAAWQHHVQCRPRSFQDPAAFSPHSAALITLGAEHVYSLAHKGEAIGVHAATGKRDEAVTFRHAAAVNYRIPLNSADCKAAEDTATSSSVAPGKAPGSDPTAAFKTLQVPQASQTQPGIQPERPKWCMLGRAGKR